MVSTDGKQNSDTFSMDNQLKLRLKRIGSNTSESESWKDERFQLSCPLDMLPPHPNATRPGLMRLKALVQMVQNKHKASDNIERIHVL